MLFYINVLPCDFCSRANHQIPAWLKRNPFYVDYNLFWLFYIFGWLFDFFCYLFNRLFFNYLFNYNNLLWLPCFCFFFRLFWRIKIEETSNKDDYGKNHKDSIKFSQMFHNPELRITYIKIF